MEFEGEFQVRAPVEVVFRTFLNPEEIRGCMPDLQQLEVYDQDHYRTVVKAGVGFIKGTFDFDVRVVEREEPRRARLKAQGKGPGSGVNVDSSVELEDTGNGTRMRWQAEAKVLGKLASVGARLLRSTTEKQVNQFFDCVRSLLEAGESPPGTG